MMTSCGFLPAPDTTREQSVTRVRVQSVLCLVWATPADSECQGIVLANERHTHECTWQGVSGFERAEQAEMEGT